ncbi:hypothetical protein WR25_02740 [Diploscapter pachys]|uniref:F-box domain-containing protein n=1 Tax=Diploscapter pachys TaxID=2018661 RepID=A0A2A2L1Y0_9BILA|nr:hypothetical protein WR25_02740 [Diploscapter pachys]
MFDKLPVELVWLIYNDLPLRSLAQTAKINRRTHALATGRRSPVREKLQRPIRVEIKMYESGNMVDQELAEEYGSNQGRKKSCFIPGRVRCSISTNSSPEWLHLLS